MTQVDQNWPFLKKSSFVIRSLKSSKIYSDWECSKMKLIFLNESRLMKNLVFERAGRRVD